MSLRRAPQRHQRIEIAAWAGTPPALVDLAETIRNLLPEGSFQASVSSDNLDERETDTPAGLSEVQESDKVTGFSIKADLSKHSDDGSFQRWAIELTMFRSRGQVWVFGPSERETRTMVVAIEDALRRHRPAWTWIKSSMFMTVGAGLLLSLVFSVGVFLVAIAAGLESKFAWVGAALVWLLTYLMAFSVFEFLFPGLLVYDTQSRARRFAGWFLSIVIIPLIIGIVLLVVTNPK